MNPNINLILASGSPRRKELLKNAGWKFEVIIPDETVEAAVSDQLPAAKFVEVASFRKAEHVAAKLKDAIVVAADTVAVCENEILGKPVDRNHAKQMLSMLSGTDHHVLTGVTIWHVPSGEHTTHVESTLLRMATLTESVIEEYLETEQWIGKAGAFGFQDNLSWISIVDGLESNVVGLPIELLPELISGVQH